MIEWLDLIWVVWYDSFREVKMFVEMLMMDIIVRRRRLYEKEIWYNL